jgi:hypothetical protein
VCGSLRWHWRASPWAIRRRRMRLVVSQGDWRARLRVIWPTTEFWERLAVASRDMSTTSISGGRPLRTNVTRPTGLLHLAPTNGRPTGIDINRERDTAPLSGKRSWRVAASDRDRGRRIGFHGRQHKSRIEPNSLPPSWPDVSRPLTPGRWDRGGGCTTANARVTGTRLSMTTWNGPISHDRLF